MGGGEVRFGVRGHVRAFRGRDMSRHPKRRRAAAVQRGDHETGQPATRTRVAYNGERGELNVQ